VPDIRSPAPEMNSMAQNKDFIKLFQSVTLNTLGICNNSKSGMALR
jgi:hypothetical protein